MRKVYSGIPLLDSCAKVREYLFYLESVKGCLVGTIKGYSTDLFRYANYCLNHEISLEKATPYEVQSFIADLSAENLSPGSINRCLTSIRGFYHWMVRFGKRKDNPCTSLRNVKISKKIPTVLWEKEMASFAEESEKAGILWTERDKALILTMYSAGLRISELVSLSMGKIKPDFTEAKITGKGGKERFVFFSDEAKTAIAEYLPSRAERCRKAGIAVNKNALFINRSGKPLSVKGVRWIISRYAQISGIGKNIHPHALRHSFATHLVNSGCDIRIVQELLGHSSLSTTQRYTHVNIENLKKVYSTAHPHAGGKNEK